MKPYDAIIQNTTIAMQLFLGQKYTNPSRVTQCLVSSTWVRQRQAGMADLLGERHQLPGSDFNHTINCGYSWSKCYSS
jgi:hypothetical protein